MGKNKRNRPAWAHIEMEPSNEKITDAVGLGVLVETFERSSLFREFIKCLPERKHVRSIGTDRLALTMIASILYGHDSLDDLEEFREDPYLLKVMNGQVVAPRTMGDYLRDFTVENIANLNRFLVMMSRSLRAHLSQSLPKEFKPGAMVIDLDSTPHVQSGSKMEGLAYNYKGQWCLDSLVAYDDYGLCHGMDLRPGNTYTSVGAKEKISDIFENLKHHIEKHFRGDSGFCQQDVIEECLRRGITFTIAAHDARTEWKERRDEIAPSEWEPIVYTDEQKEKSLKSRRKLPKVEFGRIYWSPEWAPSLRLPIVIKRTWKEGKPKDKANGQVRLPFDLIENDESGFWEYYAIVTNQNLHLKSYQEVFSFYQKRGQAENFIREEKYGYDLKHFPCQKLRANHAYGLLAMVAHNILRWAAIIEKPDRPNFAKKLRRRFIHVPGKLVSGSRKTKLRIPHAFFKEVSRLLQALTALPIPSLVPSYKLATV